MKSATSLMHRSSGSGNPHWGKAMQPPMGPPALTQFETLVARLKLPPEDWPRSRTLRDFARRNASRFYVPEYLLDLWGIAVDEDFAAGRSRGAL